MIKVSPEFSDLVSTDDLELLPEDVPIPLDNPQFFDKKAKGCNRHPAAITEKSWINSIAHGGMEIVDPIAGLGPHFAKRRAPVDSEDDEKIKLSPELQARISSLASGIVAATSRVFMRALGKAVPTPMQKRFKAVPSFGACTCAEEGRKCLACREKNVSHVAEEGNRRIIFWEGGETYELVER